MIRCRLCAIGMRYVEVFPSQVICIDVLLRLTQTTGQVDSVETIDGGDVLVAFKTRAGAEQVRTALLRHLPISPPLTFFSARRPLPKAPTTPPSGPSPSPGIPVVTRTASPAHPPPNPLLPPPRPFPPHPTPSKTNSLPLPSSPPQKTTTTTTCTSVKLALRMQTMVLSRESGAGKTTRSV